jgi:acyl-ACP thioesterase
LKLQAKYRSAIYEEICEDFKRIHVKLSPKLDHSVSPVATGEAFETKWEVTSRYNDENDHIVKLTLQANTSEDLQEAKTLFQAALVDVQEALTR